MSHDPLAIHRVIHSMHSQACSANPDSVADNTQHAANPTQGLRFQSHLPEPQTPSHLSGLSRRVVGSPLSHGSILETVETGFDPILAFDVSGGGLLLYRGCVKY